MLTKERIKEIIISTVLDDYFSDLADKVEDFTTTSSKENSKLWFEALFELLKEHNSDAYDFKDNYKLVSDEEGEDYYYEYSEEDDDEYSEED